MLSYILIKFSKLYMKNFINYSVINQDLWMIEIYFTLPDWTEESIRFIKTYKGFTIVVWYKRGVVNYRELVTSNNINNSNHNNKNNNENIQVHNGEISYHIVNMKLSNWNFLSHDRVLSHALDNLKLDVPTFHQI